MTEERDRWVALALALFCVAAAVVRYLVLVQDAPAPATVDGGNWLAFGRGLLGEHVRSSTIVYPPVIPLAVLASVSALGAAHGVAFVAALTSLAPALGMFIALRDRAPAVVAASASALLVVGAATGEAAAWGGYPQLLGFGIAMAFLRWLDDALTEGSLRWWRFAGVSLAALVATSHLIALAAVVAAVFLAALHAVSRRDRERPRVTWPALAWLAAPSMLLAPIYVRLVMESVAGLDDRPPFNRLRLGDVPDHLRHIFRDAEPLWLPLLVLALLTPVALADRWRTPLWRLLVALTSATVICTVALHESRFLYFAALPSVVALVLWSQTIEIVRRVATFAVPVILAIQAWAGLRLFDGQYEFYAEVDRGMYAALRWLETQTPDNARVAVANSNDLPVGWWVEGLSQRRALVGSPLRWLTFEDEQERARRANDIFSETFPDEAAFALARRYGVDYLLVPSRWAGGPRARVSDFAAAHPERVPLQNRSVVVFRV